MTSEHVQPEVLAFFRERLKTTRVVCCSTIAEFDARSAFSGWGLVVRPSVVRAMTTRLAQFGGFDEVIAFPFEPNHSLVVVEIAAATAPSVCIAAVLDGSLDTATLLMTNVCEAWRLTRQIERLNCKLEEHRLKDQRFRAKENWLRHALLRSNQNCASDRATVQIDRILHAVTPLIYSDDLFLIVDSQTSHRTGLESKQYGRSKFNKTMILDALNCNAWTTLTQPLLRESIYVGDTSDTTASIIAVPFQGDEWSGSLVAIHGSSGYPEDWKSSDVRLLEDAGLLIVLEVTQQQERLQHNESLWDTLSVLRQAIEARDPYTRGHSDRVAELARSTARHMCLSEQSCEEIYLAGLLHDIGKIGINDAILLKSDKLTDEEFAVVQQHPEVGYRLVERLGPLQFALPGILHHHERWDGNGYPHRLSGEGIPLVARILAVADAFDAMTSSRPYRPAMSTEQALHNLCAGAGTQWDPRIVSIFRSWLGGQSPIAPTTQRLLRIDNSHFIHAPNKPKSVSSMHHS